MLVRVPQYRRDLAEIKPAPGEEAQPFTSLLRMESPTFELASADTEIKFDQQPIPNSGSPKWTWVEPVSLDGEGALTLVLANDHEIQIGNESFVFHE